MTEKIIDANFEEIHWIDKILEKLTIFAKSKLPKPTKTRIKNHSELLCEFDILTHHIISDNIVFRLSDDTRLFIQKQWCNENYLDELFIGNVDENKIDFIRDIFKYYKFYC